ncbi:hypothetical protein B0H11DRAFT_2272809, partial [Mycena galericulata]
MLLAQACVSSAAAHASRAMRLGREPFFGDAIFLFTASVVDANFRLDLYSPGFTEAAAADATPTTNVNSNQPTVGATDLIVNGVWNSSARVANYFEQCRCSSCLSSTCRETSWRAHLHAVQHPMSFIYQKRDTIREMLYTLVLRRVHYLMGKYVEFLRRHMAAVIPAIPVLFKM